MNSSELQTTNSNLSHLAVIMDGNRRWAKTQSMNVSEGHRAGVTALQNLVKLCPDYGIEYLTAYAFSTENWKRSPIEREFIFKLLEEVSIKELSRLHDNNVRVKFIGDLRIFQHSSLYQALIQLEDKTKNNTGLKLQIALNYGSLDELAHAIKEIREDTDEDKIQDLDPEKFSDYLYTRDIPDPELLIRTGGDHRLSNYLLWQSVNAKLAFTDVFWPDFSKQDLESLLSSYKQSTQAKEPVRA